jgi:hypothetical protein
MTMSSKPPVQPGISLSPNRAESHQSEREAGQQSVKVHEGWYYTRPPLCWWLRRSRSCGRPPLRWPRKRRGRWQRRSPCACVPNNGWIAAGYAPSLDPARPALRSPRRPIIESKRPEPVGMVGTSGGGVARNWAPDWPPGSSFPAAAADPADGFRIRWRASHFSF